MAQIVIEYDRNDATYVKTSIPYDVPMEEAVLVLARSISDIVKQEELEEELLQVIIDKIYEIKGDQ